MKTRIALLSLLLLPLLACTSEDAGDSAAQAPATDAAAAAQTAPANDSAPAAAATADPATAGADSPAQAQPAEPAATPAAAPQGPPLVAGEDYVEIRNGQPYAPLDGKIEVVEVFAYWCGACAQLDPLVSAWSASLPEDVRFSYVPAVFSDDDNYPRAFFAAQAAGAIERTHSPTFRAIHIERSLSPKADIDAIAEFYGSLGLDAAQLRSTMQSFAVEASVNRASQFAIRSGVRVTPTLIVNGKYRVQGDSFEEILANTDALIARERAATR